MNPYLVEGPAVISFSGGRTSAYMLFQILKAYGGKLPDTIIVLFANTGKEREETLRFVHECSVRWGVEIIWIEWRDGDPGFEQVGYNSADRRGDTFKALIRKKGYLPNAVTRFCTQELKIRAMRNYCNSLGWSRWVNIIGLRYDEGLRVMKALERNDAGKERFTVAMPMSRARVTERDHIWPFWLGENVDPVNPTHPLPQGFDLGLRKYEGNCDNCFLKNRGKLQRLMRDNPESADWWIEQERETGKRFVSEYSYSGLLQGVRDQGHLFEGFVSDDDGDHDAECGLTCAPVELAG